MRRSLKAPLTNSVSMEIHHAFEGESFYRFKCYSRTLRYSEYLPYKLNEFLGRLRKDECVIQMDQNNFQFKVASLTSSSIECFWGILLAKNKFEQMDIGHSKRKGHIYLDLLLRSSLANMYYCHQGWNRPVPPFKHLFNLSF